MLSREALIAGIKTGSVIVYENQANHKLHIFKEIREATHDVYTGGIQPYRVVIKGLPIKHAICGLTLNDRWYSVEKCPNLSDEKMCKRCFGRKS